MLGAIESARDYYGSNMGKRGAQTIENMNHFGAELSTTIEESPN
jgi:hypothetical protein